MSLANSSITSSSTHPVPNDQGPDQTKTVTHNIGGAPAQAQKFMPPPRVVPRSPRSLRAYGIDSPEQNRGRSESSPASLASPSKPKAPGTVSSAPIATQTLNTVATPMLTPIAAPTVMQKTGLPILALSVLTGDNISDASPPPSPTKLMRLRISKRISSRINDREAGRGSTSAPTTPRKTSASEPERIKSPNKVTSSDVPAQSSPRKVDQELILLSTEIAAHWAKAIQGDGSGSKGIRKSGAAVFLGQPVKIPVDQFSPELRKRLPASFNDSTITHSSLISSLYGQSFERNPGAKVLLITKRSVMQDYGDKKLMLADLESRSESDPAAKERYKQNMEDRALDCVKYLFGAGTIKSPGSVLSEELVAMWRAMDGQLVALNLGRVERERLAYELVVSRMVLRTAKGNDTEAGQAIPTLFLATIKEAATKFFPQFCRNVLQQFDKERAAPTSTASNAGDNLLNTSASSSSSSSTNSSSTSASSSNSASSNSASSNSASSNNPSQ